MKYTVPEDLYDDMAGLKNTPDRLWRRVLITVQKNKLTRPTPGGSNLFHECCRFLRRWSAAEPENYDAMYRDFPTIMPAFLIYQDNGGIKWYMEAGLTSTAAIADVGKYIGESPAVVSRYAQLFYDVKDWMDAEGCIAAYVLRPKAIAFSQIDNDFLYKTIAYAYGWDLFKAFVSVKELLPAHRNKLQTTFRDAIIKNGWLAANKLRLNNYNALEAIARCLDLDTLKVQEDSVSNVSQQKDFENVKAMLLSCKMDIMQDPQYMKPAELPEAVEVKHGN